MGYRQLRTHAVTVAVAALMGASASVAQGNDAILDLLVKKGVINQREANNIREQADADMAKQMEVTSKTKVAPFLQSLEWAGDMRLRGEYFSFGDGVTNGAANNDRLRFRYRLRFGFIAKLQDWATVGVRLATGGTDAVSSNQTMGSCKTIGLDQAYIAVTPPFADWMTLTGGKFDSKVMWQPAFGSPMVYDNDLNLEGAHERVAYSFGEQKQYKVFGSFGQFVMNENAAANDVYLLEFQLGAEAKTGPVKTTVAAGTYYTQNLGGVNRGTAEGLGGMGNNGNSVSAAGNYVDDFRVFYGRGETAWTISEKAFLGTPNLITFSGEYLQNVNDGWESKATEPA
ncbi:MAG: putative porin, partial [Verrucomicrobiia bacterium]